MLEHLDAWEFEDWCKLVLERQHGCRVELTRRTGDEGRDLIVHHQDGPIVVECKHYPEGSVGRPAVQKLHSAVVTYGATRGLLVTSGRFSEEARGYLRKVRESISLVDGVQLDVIAQRVGVPVTATGSGGHAFATPTIPSGVFPDVLTASVLAPDRYADGEGRLPALRVIRKTTYDPFFVARFDAVGRVDTAVGEKTAAWAGDIWLDVRDGTTGFGPPPGLHAATRGPEPLSAVLDRTPGPVPEPAFHASQAVEHMRSQLLGRLSTRVTYTGRNNVRYSKIIAPSRQGLQVNQLQLLYTVRQELRIDGLGRSHEGSLREGLSTLELHMPSLAACGLCGGKTHAGNQVFCADCGVTAHRPSILRGESFRCIRCRALVCRRHARLKGTVRGVQCARCASAESPALPPRWLAPFALAMAVTLLVFLHLRFAHPADVRPHVYGLAAAWFLLGARVWPRGAIGLSGKPLVYEIRSPPPTVATVSSRTEDVVGAVAESPWAEVRPP